MSDELGNWYMEVYRAVNELDPWLLAKAIRMVEAAAEGEE